MLLDSVSDPDDLHAADERGAAYCTAIHEAFKAAAAGAETDAYVTIGGVPVRLRFAGEALMPRILPALAHLPTWSGSPPHLTVCLWDSASTGMALPPHPWLGTNLVVRGDVRGFNGRQIRLAFLQKPELLNAFDATRGRGFFWTRAAAELPYWESSSPLRVVLHWWASAARRQLVHGAAVGTPAGGVLLGGRSGSGKSSCAMACLSSDLLYAGDDYVLVQTDPAPHVYSLYCTGKLDCHHLTRFPHLTGMVSNSEKRCKEKALLFLYPSLAGRLTTGFPLRALLLPRVTDRPTPRLEEVSPATALLALAPSTLYPLPGTGPQSFQILAQLVQALPCFRLHLGTVIEKIPEMIAGLLARL